MRKVTQVKTSQFLGNSLQVNDIISSIQCAKHSRRWVDDPILVTRSVDIYSDHCRSCNLDYRHFRHCLAWKNGSCYESADLYTQISLYLMSSCSSSGFQVMPLSLSPASLQASIFHPFSVSCVLFQFFHHNLSFNFHPLSVVSDLCSAIISSLSSRPSSTSSECLHQFLLFFLSWFVFLHHCFYYGAGIA